MEIVLKWFGVITLLVFVYLVVFYGDKSSMVITALSKASSNNIMALQGRTPGQF